MMRSFLRNKRVRAEYVPVPRPKRRRVIRRRRRFRRRGSSSSYTNRSLFASAPFKFRSRKLAKRRWRAALWRETLFKQHYKTIFSVADGITTPAAGFPFQRSWMRPWFTEVANVQFWKTLGGLQDPGFGIAPAWGAAGSTNDPLNIIVRGGVLWACLYANSNTVDSIRVRMQVVFPKQQQRNFTDTADSNSIGFPGTANGYLGTAGINLSTSGFNGLDRPAGWSLQDAPDYHEYFYPPFIDKSADLKPGDDLTVSWRLKPRKVDTDAFNRGSEFYPWIIVYISEMADVNAAQGQLTLTRGWNFSFAASDTLS